MSRSGKQHKKSLSKWQTLMKFPDSLFMIEQSLKTRKIWGQKVVIDQYIDQATKSLKYILYGLKIHEDFNRQRSNLISKGSNKAQIEDPDEIIDLFSIKDLENNEIDEFFKDNLDDLIVADYSSEEAENGEEKTEKKIDIDNFLSGNFRPSDYNNITESDVNEQINFVKIQEDSYLEANVFPKGYHCWKCRHFMLLDSVYNGNLKCPCCQSQKMEQEALVFICPICAELKPIVPFWEHDLTGIVNQEIPCPDQTCNGHIHLFIDNQSLFNSTWECSECRSAFVNKTTKVGKRKQRRVVLYCNKCGVYSKDEKYNLRIPMVLKPTTARIFNPLTFDAITVNNKPLNRANLEANLNDLKSKQHPLYWNLAADRNLQMLVSSNFAIKNIYLVNDIKIFNSVFGYQSALKNILKIEPIPKFFKYGNKYDVYFFEYIGNGLVIELDTDKIVNRLSRIGVEETISYEDLMDRLLLRLQVDKIQNLLHDTTSDGIKLFKALHTFNHILLQNIFKRIGLESFRSKILMKDGLIFIHEIEDVSTGGLYQLTLRAGSRIELLEFLKDCEDNLKSCIHDCEDYCKQCSFIDDYYCRPFINEEVNRWLPSNSFLSRKFAKNIMLK